jgi:hypothetical protein
METKSKDITYCSKKKWKNFRTLFTETATALEMFHKTLSEVEHRIAVYETKKKKKKEQFLIMVEIFPSPAVP